MSRAAPVNRDELTAALMRAMRDASGMGVLHSQAIATRLGLSSSDLECLDMIVLRGPLTAGDIARATGLTTGAITGVIDRMERAGFAARAHDPADRRKVLVRALPAVERRIAPLFKPMEQAALSVLSRYSDKELALVLGFLERAYEASVAAMKTMSAETAGPGEGEANRKRARARRGAKRR
jgi:DNA-binding MarR family transcriptional regulator